MMYLGLHICICVCVCVCMYIWVGSLHRAACRILVPQPGIKLTPSAVIEQSPNHWTIREFPNRVLFVFFNIYFIAPGLSYGMKDLVP